MLAEFPSKTLSWWMLLLMALLAAGVYANTLKNDFAFDDIGVIVSNDHVRNWTGWGFGRTTTGQGRKACCRILYIAP